MPSHSTLPNFSHLPTILFTCYYTFFKKQIHYSIIILPFTIFNFIITSFYGVLFATLGANASL